MRLVDLTANLLLKSTQVLLELPDVVHDVLILLGLRPTVQFGPFLQSADIVKPLGQLLMVLIGLILLLPQFDFLYTPL